MSFKTFFEHLGSAIHSALVALFGQSALDKVDADIKVILADDVRAIFVDAITAANTLAVGTGADKRAQAFAQIVTDLKAQGIALADHSVNLGIELVVGLLKAKTPAAQ